MTPRGYIIVVSDERRRDVGRQARRIESAHRVGGEQGGDPVEVPRAVRGRPPRRPARDRRRVVREPERWDHGAGDASGVGVADRSVRPADAARDRDRHPGGSARAARGGRPARSADVRTVRDEPGTVVPGAGTFGDELAGPRGPTPRAPDAVRRAGRRVATLRCSLGPCTSTEHQRQRPPSPPTFRFANRIARTGSVPPAGNPAPTCPAPSSSNRPMAPSSTSSRSSSTMHRMPWPCSRAWRASSPERPRPINAARPTRS